jgi:predicted transposase YdaD
LERIDTKHITKDFKDRDSDIVYRAKIEGGDVVFCVLLELQSEPDFTMPFRLLVYMTELLRRMFADRKDNPERVLRRLGRVLELSRRLTEDERLQLKDWIFDVILKKAKNRLTDDTIERIKKTFEREEATEMTYAIERAIDEIEQRGIRKGKLEGMREGMREGKLEGMREGKSEGMREGMLKTALAMLGDGLSLETASKYSGIPADELRQYTESRKPQ